MHISILALDGELLAFGIPEAAEVEIDHCRGQNLLAFRALKADDGHLFGDVIKMHFWEFEMDLFPTQSCQQILSESRASDNVELLIGYSSHGDVGLNSAGLVQHEAVGAVSNWIVHASRAKPFQGLERILAANFDLETSHLLTGAHTGHS